MKKLKRLCQNCRCRVKGSWCTAHETHKPRKGTCDAHMFKKELGVGK